MAKDYKGPVEYSIEIAIEKIENLLKEDYFISKRSLALLVLQQDREMLGLVKEKEPAVLNQIEDIINEVKMHYVNPVTYELALERHNEEKLCSCARD